MRGILQEGQVRVTSDRHNAFTYHEQLVSLFDFGTGARYDSGPPSNIDNMMGWLTGMQVGRSTLSIWLEADVDKMGSRFYDA